MTIEKWYDKHTKSYVIQKKDKDGNQIGEAIYCGNKEEAENIMKELEQTPKQRYRAKTKQIAIEFNMETEADILDFLLGKSNRQGYIKELIRNDMNISSKKM